MAGTVDSALGRALNNAHGRGLLAALALAAWELVSLCAHRNASGELGFGIDTIIKVLRANSTVLARAAEEIAQLVQGIPAEAVARLILSTHIRSRLRSPNLRRVQADPELVALGLLVDRRDELGRARTEALNRIHRLLTELVPGGAKKFLSAMQARALTETIAPADPAARVRLRLVLELIDDLGVIDRKTKAADKELKQLVCDRGSTLMDMHGIGPSGAARLLADTDDIHRFASRDKFASWNGTAPLDASSGQQQRHRLSRAGNRKINRVLHVMAVVQLRNHKGEPLSDVREG
jgi:transposase